MGAPACERAQWGKVAAPVFCLYHTRTQRNLSSANGTLIIVDFTALGNVKLNLCSLWIIQTQVFCHSITKHQPRRLCLKGHCSAHFQYRMCPTDKCIWTIWWCCLGTIRSLWVMEPGWKKQAAVSPVLGANKILYPVLLLLLPWEAVQRCWAISTRSCCRW